MILPGLFKMRRNGYSGPFFIALLQFFMGLWLLAPDGAMTASPRTYEFALQVAPPRAWGAFLLAASVSMVVAAYRRRPRAVSLAALPTAFAFFVLFATYVIANPVSLQVPIMMVLTIRSVSIYREFTARRDDPHLTGEN